MSHFDSMCCSSPRNPQVLFYSGHNSHFDDRELNILCKHNIQSFVHKTGDTVHDQPNNNGPNMKLKNSYGNERFNWMRHHRTLTFTLSHMNYVLIATWEDFKLSSLTITQDAFKKSHILPLSPPDIDANYQSCIAGTQQSNREKSYDIGQTAKYSIVPIEME